MKTVTFKIKKFICNSKKIVFMCGKKLCKHKIHIVALTAPKMGIGGCDVCTLKYFICGQSYH